MRLESRVNAHSRAGTNQLAQRFRNTRRPLSPARQPGSSDVSYQLTLSSLVCANALTLLCLASRSGLLLALGV